MPKTKNLNGLPSNLASSYLSTFGYYNGGYMADWINFIARDKNVGKITIDVLNKRIEPKVTEIKPLLAYLDKLKGIVNKELENNGFERDFIKKAVLNFEIPIESKVRTITCYPELTDENGKKYNVKNGIVETAYEVNFNPVQKLSKVGFIKRIKSLFG